LQTLANENVENGTQTPKNTFQVGNGGKFRNVKWNK
jgi:hypothetical protein